MRKIKTANIKVDAFPRAAAKKDLGKTSKKDFMEQLESFLAKDKKAATKGNETKEVTKKEDEPLEVEETEEEFDELIHINLVDLNQLAEQPVELGAEISLVDEVGEIALVEMSDMNLDQLVETVEVPEVTTEELVSKLESVVNGEIAPVAELLNELIEPLDEMQVEAFLLELETQLNEQPELEVKDVIEGLLSEQELKLDKNGSKIDTVNIESSSDVKSVLPEYKQEVPVNYTRNLSGDNQLEEVQVQETEENMSVEQPEETTEIKGSELGIESEVEAPVVELSTMDTFEPMNRVDLTTETSTSIQSVAQEDFISSIETLMIEETDVTNGADKVTTARIQLTPEHLGKVDLQVEINGKELTAKLFVEQKETKEWIDQQIAHLKEKLLTQEITVKDFQVVVHEENLNDAFMSSEDNPFFKQKEKDSQTQKEQRLMQKQVTDVPVQQTERSYSTRNGISLLV